MVALATAPRTARSPADRLTKKGAAANPYGRPARPKPAMRLPELLAQPKEKYHHTLLKQAYELAVRMGYDLVVDLSKSGKKNFTEIRNRMISWGITADKVLTRDTEGGLQLYIPAQVLTRLSGILALKFEPVNKSALPASIDIQSQDPPNAASSAAIEPVSKTA